MDENTRIFYCSCGCSALVVSVDEFDSEILISPWSHVNFYGHSWRAKLSFIRQILKWGHPYQSFTIHTPGEARELGNYLIELADELVWIDSRRNGAPGYQPDHSETIGLMS